MATRSSSVPPESAGPAGTLSNHRPQSIEEPAVATADSTRPGISRQWQTARVTAAPQWEAPGMKRYPTSFSVSNKPAWKHNTAVAADDDSTTSSSSDDDDDDDDKEHKKHFRRKRSNGGQRPKGHYSRFDVGNDEFKTRGRVSKKDGRLNISVNETSNRGYLAKALGATFLKHVGTHGDDEPDSKDKRGWKSDASSETITTDSPRPKLNIVVMVIGSRGDIQPFLKLGKNLKEYGHKVRIATHPAFKDFVEKDSGLEFFSVGGDPAELMAFMVKNPGMIPTMDTLKKGEVGRRRQQMAEMFEGFWRACINATDDEKDVSNLKMMGAKSPFIADAIIANPPCFAHIHCAERLGIPLHLMFTFPYTPTQAFPHPLANIRKSNVDPGYANFMSYPLVEMMTWQGLGDLVNNFRVKTLGLEPVSTLWAPGQLYRLKVPFTYLWSPGLVPKPKDWGPEIDIAGFVFLDLASSFKPPEDLVKFLDEGEQPIYIGFGSIVVDEPDKFTKMIFEAVKKAGVRALVSKGWGGLGGDNTPDNVYMLENTPHDWLFPKVSAVVHHGGAGTTAIGLKCGKPTMIVPFFGDQMFWGNMIGEAGAGANPVPHKQLTADKLAEGIKQCLTDEARVGAEKIARDIEKEGDGSRNAVTSFHRSLVLRGHNSMRCSILEDRVAVWSLKNTSLRLSALAADLLVERKKLTWKQLRLIRHNEWNDFEGPGEPISGGATAIMSTVTGIATGVGGVPYKIAKSSRRRAKHEEKKRRKSEDARRKSQDAGRNNGTGGVVYNKDFNTQKPNGKPENGNRYIAQASGGPEPKGKEPKLPNGSAAQGMSSTGSKLDSEEHKHSMDRVTSGPDLGKHTMSGEPVAAKKAANEEQKAQDQKAKNEEQGDDNDSVLSDDPEENVAEEIGKNVTLGVGKTAGFIAKAPMDLTLAIAQGFHNAPRLYGDETVRRPTRITGIKSGLKAAGEEFTFGIYDGVTGVVTQPYTGARDHGPVGFVKGVGMGLTGFVLKDLAAIFGPFGYTFKGIHKELQKGKQPTHFIRKARIMEGQRDLSSLDEKEKKSIGETVNHGWQVVQEVFAIMAEKRAHGLRGRVHAMKERKTWRANGAFENVEMAEKALEASRRGESLEGVFAQQREELQLTKKPRKNVAQDLAQGKSGDQIEDKQVVQENASDSGLPAKEMPNIIGRN
ncbi:probable sterol glucosyltransferase [Rhynchosporium agropyri]|uniref:Probable sterol glucosyltransferase n=1 Tax=Rhynchosporium agropyri TaxID=914238 RepID=A0A1E1KH47_9HELO|nr:probable sterol glucosyltransferase [Rhynchosporium agropyri]